MSRFLLRSAFTRLVLPLALGAVLAGPAAARGAAPQAPRTLVLEDFFRGPLQAQGEFLNTRDNTRRGVKVKMHGDWDGKVLTLVEDFVYSDGERDRKTWRFTKVGEGRYVGTREDVVGQAEVTQDGPDVKLTYVATVRTKDGGSYDIRFADRLSQTGPATVLNTAKLTYLFFIDVGQVSLTIQKAGRPAKVRQARR